MPADAPAQQSTGLFPPGALPEVTAPGDVEWCDYPAPTRPAAGCWSWLNGWIKSRADCAACECVKPEAAT